MAAIPRIEQVRMTRKDGIAKITGTLFCAAGASVNTLYKDPSIFNPAPFVETDNSHSWIIYVGGELFSVFCAGAVASGLAFPILLWGIDRGKPVFVANLFRLWLLPLLILLLWAKYSSWAGILRIVLIIGGFYLALWGQIEERKFSKERTHRKHSGAHEQQG